MEKSTQQRQPLIPEVKPKTRRKFRPDYYDYSLVAIIILLVCFGLIMLYSTTSYTAELEFGDDMYYLKKQGIISAVSILGALVISRFDYHILNDFAEAIYVLAIFLMLLVRTPLGISAGGARRWLGYGSLSFQPSELAKIAVIICIPYMIVKMGRQIKTLKATMMLLGMGLLLAGSAFVFTENLSTAIIIFVMSYGMIFLAHPRTRPFLLVGAGAVIAAVIAVLIINATLDLDVETSFRLKRIIVWLRPEQDASEKGFQTLQALYAIGSGGFFGRGLGNGIQKLGTLPEAENDMIFSIICEELGVFGAIVVMMLFGYLLYRLVVIAQNAPDLFGSLMVSGIFIHIALQVVLNIAVVLNLLPNTGVTLPFISYGGTSVVFLMAELGLALSVSRQIKLENTEKPQKPEKLL